MSSALSSLKRTPKAPLPGCMRKFAFHSSPQTEQKEIDNLLEEVSTNIASKCCQSQTERSHQLQQSDPSKLKPTLTKTPRKPSPQPCDEAPSDQELLSLMMGRISILEAKVVSQNKEIIQKNRKISRLEDKLKIMQQNNDESSPAEMAKLLKMQCVMLQKQVQEMEDFLGDYGLIWVGETDAIDVNIDCGSSRRSKNDDIWKPDDAAVPTLPKLDYDIILEKIKELNLLAGDGVAKVERTKDGARLKYPDPVQLTLYKNGILMFDGPFRPLSDLITQECLSDIMEGYFPSELQSKYPDGVPFKVTDKRDVFYKDTRHAECFPGIGNTLNNPDVEVSSDLDTTLHPSTSDKQDHQKVVVDERPGPALTVKQFVDKLPSCVIKNGKVIDIRQSIWSKLKDDGSETQISVVNTEATQEMKERIQSATRQRRGSPECMTTLRVKSANGNHTFVLKMKPQETIGDLRRYLDGQKNSNSFSAYQILSTFPHKVLDDNNATLQDCGLTPSATLRLKYS